MAWVGATGRPPVVVRGAGVRGKRFDAGTCNAEFGMRNSHFAIGQSDGAVDLRLERFRGRLAFADELPHLVSVS